MATAKKAPAKAAAKKESDVPTSIDLDTAIKEKLETLHMNDLHSQAGLKIALDHILADVKAGHVDTDLEGRELENYLKGELGIK